jgi:hypothetical protein
MPKEKEDLWPEDLGHVDLVTPVTILREQASVLGKRTNYILRGEVETQTRGETIYHTFYVVAPALENYRYEVLTVRHEVIFYPVDINCSDAGMYGRTVKNEDELKQALKTIFTSEKLKKVIGALLAQAQS